jgi:hypothetical protein
MTSPISLSGDFKTAARMWPDDKADKGLAGNVFSYALRRCMASPTFRFDVITKTKKPAVKSTSTRTGSG